MPSETRKRRKGAAVIEVPAPILQVLPHHRVRIDPSVVADLHHWLYAFRQRYENAVKQTGRGLKGHARALWRGRVRHARVVLSILDEIGNALFESVDLRDVDASRRQWEEALTAMSRAV